MKNARQQKILELIEKYVDDIFTVSEDEIATAILALIEKQKLISEVAKVNKNVILVLSGGAPFVMPARELYRAAIHGYLGGQAGASAMADAMIVISSAL